MRVVVLPADESACGYYRMKLPAGAVQQVRPDWNVEVYRPRDIKLGGDAKGRLWGINGLPDPEGIDLLIMQRVSTELQVNLLKWATSKNIATIMDVDDAMWCIDKANSAYAHWNRGPAHWRYLDHAAQIVDLTTVTTPALARRYGKHGRTEILPNCVPGDLPDVLESIRHQLDPTLAIGWAGFTHTHPGDLRVVGDAVRRVQEETGCKVRIIGDAEGAARDWGITKVDAFDPVPLGLPYYTALTAIDVALVPLQDTPFNRAKSYLKALEFAAVGVPVVASPTPANLELAKTVGTQVVYGQEAWYQALRVMLEYSKVRGLMASTGLDGVRDYHTYEGNAERWAAAWERAVSRKARMAV